MTPPVKRGTPAPHKVGPLAKIGNAWLSRIDPVAAVRGMSAGFTVLVIGGLAAPLMAAYIPGLGAYSLVLASVIGFAVASRKLGNCTVPALQGATAAVGSYLLVLPLVFLGDRHIDAVQVGITGAVAVLVGMVGGLCFAAIGRTR